MDIGRHPVPGRNCEVPAILIRPRNPRGGCRGPRKPVRLRQVPCGLDGGRNVPGVPADDPPRLPPHSGIAVLFLFPCRKFPGDRSRPRSGFHKISSAASAADDHYFTPVIIPDQPPAHQHRIGQGLYRKNFPGAGVIKNILRKGPGPRNSRIFQPLLRIASRSPMPATAVIIDAGAFCVGAAAG